MIHPLLLNCTTIHPLLLNCTTTPETRFGFKTEFLGTLCLFQSSWQRALLRMLKQWAAEWAHRVFTMSVTPLAYTSFLERQTEKLLPSGQNPIKCSKEYKQKQNSIKRIYVRKICSTQLQQLHDCNESTFSLKKAKVESCIYRTLKWKPKCTWSSISTVGSQLTYHEWSWWSSLQMPAWAPCVPYQSSNLHSCRHWSGVLGPQISDQPRRLGN